MAERPVFMAALRGSAFVEVKIVDFKWVPGMSVTQKQKCVDSLHAAARKDGWGDVLEISSKSKFELGRSTSAFKLSFNHPRLRKKVCVESAFQGSKVFENSGPFPDLYAMYAAAAKKELRLRCSGELKAFDFFGQHWPLRPYTVFYDWLYLNSMNRNPQLTGELCSYSGFTDIEFNPKKSINCQAYAAALFVSLCTRGVLDEVMANRETFIKVMSQQPEWIVSTGFINKHPALRKT